MKYVVYLDESYTSDSRFTSIAACSIPVEKWRDAVEEIQKAIESSGIKEFKWQKMKNAKYRFAAIKIIDLVLGKFISQEMRLDILISDNHDTRNSVMNRDNTANFERMFYHLLANSMKRRGTGSIWGVYPDQRSGIDWETARDCLNNKGKQFENQKELPVFELSKNPGFEIRKFREANSEEKPLVQVADLFAGLAVFSILKFQQFSQWDQENNQTADMFGIPNSFSYSGADVVRFEVLRYFYQHCKAKSLGVSLRSEGGLKTPYPNNPINFWRYAPQSAYDKAPTRS